MINEFKNLTKSEIELIYKAPVYVTILIAGADDEFESKEIKKAVGIVNLRQYVCKHGMQEYYAEVNKTFNEDFTHILHSLPANAEVRNISISKELEKLNPILAKLPAKFAHNFHKSIVSLSKHVALASGGILGGSISNKEKKWVDLKMIHLPKIES